MAGDKQFARLSAEECRKQAQVCRKMAVAATVQAHGVMLEHMAETWERLAVDLQHRE